MKRLKNVDRFRRTANEEFTYSDLPDNVKKNALDNYYTSENFSDLSESYILRDMEEWLMPNAYVFGEKYDKYISMFRELGATVIGDYDNVYVADNNGKDFCISSNEMFIVDYEHILTDFYNKHADDLEIIWAYTDDFAEFDKNTVDIYDGVIEEAFDYYYNDYYGDEKAEQLTQEHYQSFIEDFIPLFKQLAQNFNKAVEEMNEAWQENIDYYTNKEFAEHVLLNDYDTIMFDINGDIIE